jgi:hypothetical protein
MDCTFLCRTSLDPAFLAERLIHYFATLGPAATDLALPELTDCEREILHLIAQQSNSEITECLLLRTKQCRTTSRTSLASYRSLTELRLWSTLNAGLGFERNI